LFGEEILQHVSIVRLTSVLLAAEIFARSDDSSERGDFTLRGLRRLRELRFCL
jgi:hypothetical protein